MAFPVGTLAIGIEYATQASLILKKLSDYGYITYVMTDFPSLFDSSINIVPYEDDGTQIWQQKRIVIKNILEEEQQVVFIDADYGVLSDIDNVNLDFLEGLSTSRLYSIESNTTKRSESLIPVMEGLKDVLKINNWKKAKWVAPNLFCLKKDREGKYMDFLGAWDKVALFLKENNYKIDDGISIGLAAHSIGWVPQKISFGYFGKMLDHKHFGTWETDGTMT